MRKVQNWHEGIPTREKSREKLDTAERHEEFGLWRSVRGRQGAGRGGWGYLQVLNAELVAVHVDGRQEDGLHLVVSQLVGGQVGSNENLGKHKAMSERGASSRGLAAAGRSSLLHP